MTTPTMPEAMLTDIVEGGIASAYARGILVVGCRECQSVATTWREKRTQGRPMAPSHKASPRCESGGREHCSCSCCF